MKAIIVLEDGTTFLGTSFGADGEVVGEAVFNTQVVGYQEILTDPSYRGQVIVMGYPHIGNYGVNDRCNESGKAEASALVVKEYSRIYSNWQAKGSLADFMKKHNVIGIEGVDTRALTVRIREHGEMRAIISTKDFNPASLSDKLKEQKKDLLETGTSVRASSSAVDSKTVIVDLGINNSTLARYAGAKLVASSATAEEILKGDPEQVVISSGPGDPRERKALIEEVKKLVGKVPIYGIQNGACVLALALNCSVYKMKVGHHGVNHPVVDPKSGKGEITAQNHSFGIDRLADSVKVVYENLNDKTIEQFQSKDGSCTGTLFFPVDERGKLAPGYQLV
jgi:carbamoyl-phosphate synthase small subunit